MGNLLMLSKMWIKLAVRKNMHNTDFDPKIYVYYVQMQAASSLEITTLFFQFFWKAVILFAFCSICRERVKFQIWTLPVLKSFTILLWLTFRPVCRRRPPDQGHQQPQARDDRSLWPQCSRHLLLLLSVSWFFFCGSDAFIGLVFVWFT